MSGKLLTQQLNSVLFSIALEAVKQGNLGKLWALSRVYFALAEVVEKPNLDSVRD